MIRPIIVAGASGAGKSFLLEHTSILNKNIKPVKKLTTRNPRSYEDENVINYLDLYFSKQISDVKNCDYCYHYSKYWYGISKNDIDKILREKKSPILIVRNSATIRRLKEDYPTSLVLYLQSGLSGNDLETILKEQGRKDINLNNRMKIIQQDFHEYASNIHLFDYVLVNYFEKDSLIEQFQSILDHEKTNNKNLIEPNYVFVVMPFNPKFDEIYEAIQTAGSLIKFVDLKIERIDNKRGDYLLTEEILLSIRKSELIVCDLTENRPNVYYELGYARGINKKVIHCAFQNTKLHFDIKDFNTIFYKSAMDLQKKLKLVFEDSFNQHC